MREILFRGKRNNGDWVFGNLFIPDKKDAPTEICIGTNVIRITYEVIPETVGQYTGLTDKNGKKIFEGDLAKPFDDDCDKMVVEFHDGSFVLCIYGYLGYLGENGHIEDGNYGVFECEPLINYRGSIEIIGNIHDNPELLKGEE